MSHVKLRKWIVKGMLCIFIPCLLKAQEPPENQISGNNLLYFSQPRQESFSMPFRLINNLTVIPASINGSDTLFFILDTGLKKSIICELSAGETLNLNNALNIQLGGSGSGSPAILSFGNTIEIGDLRGINQEFLILTDNVLRLSSRLGTSVHGLLSLQAFQALMVEINYDRRVISFYKPGSCHLLSKPGNYCFLPMQLIQGLPYIQAAISDDNENSFLVRLLLDTGASNTLYFNPQAMPGFKLMSQSRRCHLGCGIQGDISGFISRIKMLEIGPFYLHDILVSFPDSGATTHSEDFPDRNASLGSEVLRCFNLVLNFPAGEIGFIPNEYFGKEFRYNMSGIEVIASITDNRKCIVSGVRVHSTAKAAGIQCGDELLAIDGVAVSAFDLDGVYNSLLGREGKKIRLTLRRDQEILKLTFQLEKYI